MKGKFLLILSLLLTIIIACIGVGCDSADETGNENVTDSAIDKQLGSIYSLYVAYADENDEVPLSYSEWLDSIKGEAGAQGVAGNGIKSIRLVNTSNEIDEYQIVFTNSSVFTYRIRNGKDGKDGKDGNAGEDGRTPIFRYNQDNNYLEWKYTDEDQWKQLVVLNNVP